MAGAAWLCRAERMGGQEPGCGRKQAGTDVRSLQHLVRKLVLVLPGSHCGPLAAEDKSHASVHKVMGVPISAISLF